MDRTPAFIRWLSLAALADWLITRTLARSAIFMPKSPPVLLVYQVLTLAGQFASVLAALLALLGMGWLAWQLRHAFKGMLSGGLMALAGLSLVFLLLSPGGWSAVTYHLLFMAALVGLIWAGLGSTTPVERKIALLLPALALAAGALYQMMQSLYTALQWPGPAPLATALFNAGEFLAVLTPLGFWWASRRDVGQGVISPGQISSPKVKSTSYAEFTPPPEAGEKDRKRDDAGTSRPHHLYAVIPALIFVAVYFLNPAMTGILTIWSTGLSLYLPWPLYALSLWLAGMVLLRSRGQGTPVGLALLLLAAGGYAPQLSTQVFFGLIGLAMIVPGSPQNSLDGSRQREAMIYPPALKVSE